MTDTEYANHQAALVRSRFLNRCRTEIGHDSFIIAKKYRSTLLRVLNGYGPDFYTHAAKLEIAELISIFTKQG